MDSPITNLIERGLTSIWRVLKSIIHRKKYFVQIAFRLQKLRFIYKCGISSTKTAFRLQKFSFQFTKLHFELQSCVSECNSAVSECNSAEGKRTHVNLLENSRFRDIIIVNVRR